MRNIAYILLLLGYSMLTGSCQGPDQVQQPNILFIMSDDHCDRAIGVYNSRLSVLNPTPILDEIAKAGMVFENVFCTNSICTPSRASILTGQYSHVNKVYDLYDGLPGEQQYLSEEMTKAGYTTAVIGKWHLKHAPAHVDYFAVLPGQGRYMNPVIHVSEGGKKRRIRFDSTLELEIDVVDKEGHSSDVLTDMSLDWLENKRDTTKPFFLMHQFKAPHDMFVYAERYQHYLEDEFIPEPCNLYNQPGPFFGSVATRGENDSLVDHIGATVSLQPHKRNLARMYRTQIRELTGKEDPTQDEMTHHAYQLYLKEYLRCVKGIDDNLGRIMDYLEANDLLENTIIIYTSDQGMMLGEHDFIDKRWMYEESSRMPLIIHYPEMVRPGSRNDWLINNTDLAPTILALAGIEPPEYMQGRSFVPAMRGEKEPDDWREGTYYRYWMHMAHRMGNPAHFGIRTKRYKLIFYYGVDYTNVHNGQEITDKDGNRYWESTPPGWELYDLAIDPNEMFNQYFNPDYQEVVKDLKQLLREKRQEIGDTDEAFPRIREIVDAHWDE